MTRLILSVFYSHLLLCRNLSVQAKIFHSGNLFHNENISKKNMKKFKNIQNRIRGSLCFINIYCGFVLLGVILSHVISG